MKPRTVSARTNARPAWPRSVANEAATRPSGIATVPRVVTTSTWTGQRTSRLSVPATSATSTASTVPVPSHWSRWRDGPGRALVAPVDAGEHARGGHRPADGHRGGRGRPAAWRPARRRRPTATAYQRATTARRPDVPSTPSGSEARPWTTTAPRTTAPAVASSRVVDGGDAVVRAPSCTARSAGARERGTRDDEPSEAAPADRDRDRAGEPPTRR